MTVEQESRPRLAIHGCYDNDNFGDVLLMDVMSHYAYRYLKVAPVSPWVNSNSRPFVRTEVGHGWRDVFNVDAAFFGGGGYFCNYYGRSLKYSIPARIWKSRGVPYAVVGVGVGPFISPAAEREFRVVCDGAEAICVRDEESKELLSQFGAEADRIEVTADAVLSLTPEMIPGYAIAEAKRLLAPVADGRRLLGVQWGPAGPRSLIGAPLFFGRRPHSSLGDLLDELKRNTQDRDDIGIVWLLNYNRATSESIRKAVEEVLPNSLFVRSRDHWVIAALLAQLDGVMTTMLHLGITSWVLGTPPCAWASHGKTQRFYRQIGREDYVGKLGENIGQVGDWVRTFVGSPDAFASEAQGARERLRNLALRNYEVLVENVGSALKY